MEFDEQGKEKGKVDYVCGTCKSNDLLHEAFAVWDAETQKMELDNTFGEVFCKECDDYSKYSETIPYNPVVEENVQ